MQNLTPELLFCDDSQLTVRSVEVWIGESVDDVRGRDLVDICSRMDQIERSTVLQLSGRQIVTCQLVIPKNK